MNGKFPNHYPFVPMPRVLARPATCSRLLALAGLAAQVAAFPQSFSKSATEGSQSKYSLTGTVVNSVTGEPIRRALVEVSTGPNPLALTDGNGQFEFHDLPPGQMSINVRKPGYFAEPELQNSSHTAMADVGPDPEPLTLKLVPEAVISGKVQSLDGAPIESLLVHLFTSRIEDGRRRWEQTFNDTTNDEGEFRIANLKPGVYYLEFGPGWSSHVLDPTKRTGDTYPALFYPGTADLSSATPLEVAPGQQLIADLTVKAVPFVKVSGVISGANPGNGVQLQFEDQFGNNFSDVQRFDAATGQFQAAAPAGIYTLTATTWFGGAEQTAEVPLNLLSDVSGIRLTLAPGGPIPVYVSTEETRSSSRTTAGRGNMPVPSLRFIDANHLLSQNYAGVEGDPQSGVFTVPNLRPGRYLVEVGANDPWYVETARCGQTDLLSEELNITVGSQTPPIEVLLRDDGATLNVEVSADTQMASATVVVEADRGSFIQTAHISGARGTLELENLPPGRYNVFAFDHADRLEYRNRDVLERHASRATPVTLQPDGQQKVDVQLITVTE
jgi:hypothetical protein